MRDSIFGGSQQTPFAGRCARLLVMGAVLHAASALHAGVGDFDLSRSLIDAKDLVSGGSPKDGIPAISRPLFIPASKAEWPGDDDLVLAVRLGGESKAYPLSILNWHEIVNDRIADIPVAVTWCPLTRSAVVFRREVGGEVKSFGVSGLLYNSNLVMYDRSTGGLWPQMEGRALTGRLAGRPLVAVPSMLTTWGEWKKAHPDTLVLSRRTGYDRDYDIDPYRRYRASKGTMFRLKRRDPRLPPKSLVVGINIGGAAMAYPLDLIRAKGKSFPDRIAGIPVEVHPGPAGTAYITDADGNLLPAVLAYWFAWSAFNRDSRIFKGQSSSEKREVIE